MENWLIDFLIHKEKKGDKLILNSHRKADGK